MQVVMELCVAQHCSVELGGARWNSTALGRARWRWVEVAEGRQSSQELGGARRSSVERLFGENFENNPYWAKMPFLGEILNISHFGENFENTPFRAKISKNTPFWAKIPKIMHFEQICSFLGWKFWKYPILGENFEDIPFWGENAPWAKMSNFWRKSRKYPNKSESLKNHFWRNFEITPFRTKWPLFV